MKQFHTSSISIHSSFNRFPVFCSIISLVLLSTSACVPLPHFQRESPAIEGTISRNGTSAKGVAIGLAVDHLIEDGCNSVDTQTYTDANGKFNIEETEQFVSMITFADRWSNWSLCFEFPDGARAMWSNGAWGGGPSLQRLECQFGEELELSDSLLHIDAQEDNDICAVEDL